MAQIAFRTGYTVLRPNVSPEHTAMMVEAFEAVTRAQKRRGMIDLAIRGVFGAVVGAFIAVALLT